MAPQHEFCHTQLGWSYEHTLTRLIAFEVAAGLYLYAVGRHTRPGLLRLAATLPVLALNLGAPKLFCRWQEAVTITLISFNFFWLSSFKAIAWALNRGALCTQRFNLLQFIAVYATPITPVVLGLGAAPAPAAAAAAAKQAAAAASSTSEAGTVDSSKLESSTASGLQDGGADSTEVSKPAPEAAAAAKRQDSKQAVAPPAGPAPQAAAGPASPPPNLLRKHGRLGEDAGSPGAMVAAWLAKLLFICVLVGLLQFPLPGLLESLVYGLSLYSLLSAIMDGPAAAIIGLTGLRVSPHFDTPWAAGSVAAFWSKRWDLAAGNALRQLIYDCVVDGSLLHDARVHGRRPTPKRQLLGAAASFTASGLVHETIFWYLTGHTTYGVWLSFFLVQVPIIAVERVLLAALKKRGIMVPSWLRAAATLLIVVFTTQHLFWGPCSAHGVTASHVNNVKHEILSLLKLAGLLQGGSAAATAA